MNANEMEVVRRLLRDQLQSLSPAELLPRESGPTETADDNDRASREEEKSFELHLATRKTALAVNIRAALQKIDMGTFGICEICEEPIAFKRLLVNPTSLLCVTCQAEQEARETYSLSRMEVA